MAKPGGARPGSGPKTKPKTGPAAGSDQEQFLDAITARLPALLETAFELAQGVKVAMKRSSGRKPGKLLGTGIDAEGEEWEVYVRQPDATLLNKLLEHGFGRPGSREAEKPETTFIIRHNIPGKPEVGELPEAPTGPQIGLPKL